MRSFRVLGIAASLATAVALLAAPALAAGSVSVPLTYNAQLFQMPGVKLDTTKQYTPCDPKDKGATYDDHSLNATGYPTGNFTPDGSPVAFAMPALSSNNGLCITLQTGPGASNTVTIPVPAGNYTDAYFLASAGNGPALTSVTPVYGSTNGSDITAVFADWCSQRPGVAGYTEPKLPDGTTAGWQGGGRVAMSDGTADATLPCGLYTTDVSGLDSSKQLTGLTITLAAAKTAMPASAESPAGQAQDANVTLNVVALTMAGTSASGATMPKTGGNETGIAFGVALLLIGAVLAFRPRLARFHR